ncbi:MAG: SDR family oxidoreductase [Thaumarchaeota archaeon]|nr:SDR family oxidoreductase [Nitrososphaerota archaeon]
MSGANWISGKTCMITGSNSGIGKAASVAVARMGATVVMVCRDAAKGESARRDIIVTSGAKSEDVTLMLADLSSLDSVRQLAADFLKKDQKLHVLINNAGLVLGDRRVTKDGLETTFVVNYLSHFLLTNLLLGAIRSAAPSRIINVSSEAHTAGHIEFEDLQAQKNYGGMRAYSQSKLAQVLFTHELARRLAGTGVTVNSLHPGVVATNWGRHSVGAMSVGLRLISPFMTSPEKGAETSVYLASSPDVAEVTGKYFDKKKETSSSPESNDDAEALRLWKVSLALVGLPDSQSP